MKNKKLIHVWKTNEIFCFAINRNSPLTHKLGPERRKQFLTIKTGEKNITIDRESLSILTKQPFSYNSQKFLQKLYEREG